MRQYVRNLPLRPGTTPLKFAPDYERWLIEAMSHGDYDDFWKNAGSSVVDHLAEYKDVPEYHTTGWYDSWGTPVANLNFVELRKAKKSLQRLIMGPWIHSSENLNYAGEAQFTEDAALDLTAFHLRWFDHWLKGVDNGVDREPPVRIYVMGGGDAHKTRGGPHFRGWALARGAGVAAGAHGDDAVLPACKRRAVARRSRRRIRQSLISSIRRIRCRRLGGNVSSQGTLMFQGAADQRCRADFWLCSDTRPLSARNDVVVFQTRAARSRCGGDGATGGEAMGFVGRAGYGLHGEACG